MVADLIETKGASRDGDWPWRRWGLALLGAVIGLAIDRILAIGESNRWSEDATRLALATFLGVSGICFAFVVERTKMRGSILFALVAGLIVSSVLYWSGDFRSWEPWRLVSALLTVAIAAPLFQAWRDGGGAGRHIPYVAAHDRAWTNVCLWFAAWAFTGVTFALAWLLATLFGLIGIDAIEELLKKSWFAMALAGGAFGGASGLLRDREHIVSLLQRVIMMVLSVLAPVLAAGLLLFLAALPFTGLDALWETTKSTTPILLSCVVGAVILANAVIGDSPEDESRHRVMRWSAMALGAAMLPLAVIAAISTGLRIGQYGLTPARLWAVTFTAIACAYGLAYLVSLARGRGENWAAFARPANMRLAIALCALAFLLSTPLISFGAIAARDQVARLTSGRIAPDSFDWAALRFDFGPAGLTALKNLSAHGKTAEIRTAASDILKSDDRYQASRRIEQVRAMKNLVLFPKDTRLPDALRARLSEYGLCTETAPCNLIHHPGSSEAIIVGRYSVTVLRLKDGKWDGGEPEAPAIDDDAMKRINQAFARGKVEVRDVERRQVFVDGKPVGKAFE